MSDEKKQKEDKAKASSDKVDNSTSNKSSTKKSATAKGVARKTLSLNKNFDRVKLNSSGMNSQGLMSTRRKAQLADSRNASNKVDASESASVISDAIEALKKAKLDSSKDNLRKEEVEQLRQEKILSQKVRQKEIEKIHAQRIHKEKEEKELKEKLTKELKSRKEKVEENKAKVSKDLSGSYQDGSDSAQGNNAQGNNAQGSVKHGGSSIGNKDYFAKDKKGASDNEDESKIKNKKLRLKEKGEQGLRNRLTLQDAWLQTQSDYDDGGGFRYKKPKKASGKKRSSVVHDIEISNDINVSVLAHKIGIKSDEVLKMLNKLGHETKDLYQILDPETAVLIVEELGHKARFVASTSIEDKIIINDDKEQQVLRAPVVSVMGHVDHGKTSLLDALRNTDFAADESGGITQHISAYQLHTDNGNITFLDTPGHAAFASMRARGANLTDIVLLVVAADDGVMEQTIEAISHAKEANSSIIVVINKIDKPNIDIARLKSELLRYDVYTEDMGGEVIAVEVSAKTKQGLDKLIDAILLQASVMNLKAQENRKGKGRIVEYNVSKGRGIEATVIVETGSLNVGDYFVAGKVYGRVRGITSDHGKSLKKAGPSQPVLVFGFNAQPSASDDFIVVDSEQIAREVAEYRNNMLNKNISKASVTSKDLDDLFNNTKKKTLNLIVKADTDGSVEAVSEVIKAIEHDEVAVNVVQAGVGDVTESDVMLAESTSSFIIGFNVKELSTAIKMTDTENVVIFTHKIIYELIEEVKNRLSDMLEPEITFDEQGKVEVRKVFEISHLGRVAGCYVKDGMVRHDSFLKVQRDSKVIFEDTIKTLKRTTDEAKEIKKGLECGILFNKFNDVQEGDILLCYNKVVTKRKI